ncbi:MAG: carbohydrate kinase family protein [Pyrobaculum sp.]
MAVASVGNLNFDIYLKTAGLPGLDEAVEALDFYTGGGGSAANFAIAMARLGLEVRFFGAIGPDPLGELSLRELRDEGVDISYVKRVEGVRSGVVVVLLQQDGARRMVAFRGANLGLSPGDLSVEKFAGVRHIHLATGRLELIAKAREVASGVGATVSIDGGTSLAKKGLDAVRTAARGADVMFVNRVEARLLAGTEDYLSAAERLFRELSVGEVVVTLGPGGALAYDGRSFVYLDAFRLEAVDTTGAGDVFAAAYVAMFLKGRGLYERLLFANAAAAIKITRRGARSSPKYGEVVAFLESLGYKI